MSAGIWVEQAFNFIIFAILARILGVEAFGLLAMVAAFVLFSEFLVRETISDILLTRDALSSERLNSVFWLLALLGGGLTIVLYLGAGLVSNFYNELIARELLIGLSPTVLMISLTAVPVAILRREMRFRILAIRAALGAAVGGVVGIGMALSGYGVWSLVGQRLAMTATNIVMAWGAVSWRPALDVSRDHMRAILHFGHRILGLRAAELAAVQSPAVIIGAMLGPAQAGYYAIAWRVIETAAFLMITPLRTVAQPAFGAAARDDGQAADLLMDVMRLTGFLAFPAFAGLAVLSEPALILLFGQKWAPAAPVLSLMSVFGMYLCAEKVQQTFCLAAGQAGRLAVLSWVEVALAAAVIVALAPYGLSVVTAGFVAVFLLIWPLKFANLAHIAGLPNLLLMQQHLSPLLLSAAMAGVVQGVVWALGDTARILVLLIGMVTGGMVYCLLAFLFQRRRLHLLMSMARPRGTNAT
ncbi:MULTISPECIES: oligosaccharide flippase family protein [unclassified Ruegeria]|uniref:oligosaccharide flippase family protein n=1 Tax=unclassified Ruegeria TaxID=2625375 RepID=UPI001488085F|nr:MULTISPECIES: oligosaccharide flippase family protein [unclassified Ruegeria]NOD65561.1 oligosaccharide flippase family protein [Ruegeria sp. HKCCD6109]